MAVNFSGFLTAVMMFSKHYSAEIEVDGILDVGTIVFDVNAVVS